MRIDVLYTDAVGRQRTLLAGVAPGTGAWMPTRPYFLENVLQVLAGEEIPLVARIVCACEAFSAMTTDRPYRKARPHDEGLAELLRCAAPSSTLLSSRRSRPSSTKDDIRNSTPTFYR